MRLAGPDDEQLLFDWANDPGVRDMARNDSPICWNEHRDWFAAKLADDSCKIWIAETEGKPIGQIRLDREGDRAEVDISVDPSVRGHGIGTKMLTMPVIAAWPGVRRIQAAVRRGNDASATAFCKAGFEVRASDDDYIYFEKVTGNAVTD